MTEFLRKGNLWKYMTIFVLFHILSCIFVHSCLGLIVVVAVIVALVVVVVVLA